MVNFLHPLSGPVLRDTARLSQRYPPIARYGVFGVSTWPIGCDTPSPFSERFPWSTCKVEVWYPPLKRGISAILARYPMKTRQMGAIPPSAILSRKGIARDGGVSRTGPLSTSPKKPFTPCVWWKIEKTKNWARTSSAFSKLVTSNLLPPARDFGWLF